MQSRAEKVAEQLRTAILTGSLTRGERLIEQKLAAAFGVGQPTLREALKELEIQGFVRKIPQRGTYITDLSREDVAKLYEVRMALEVVAVRKAAQNMTDAALVELRASLDRMTAAANALNLAEYHRRDIEFHRVLWRLSGNEHLTAALDRVAFALFVFAILRNQRNPQTYATSVWQHGRILEGLATRDPEQACRIFEESTSHYWRTYGGVKP